MAKLILRAGALRREITLDDKPHSIGRRPANRIVLEDQAVSGRHAHIYVLGGSYQIEDLQSSNGTRVNGQPIRKQPLKHGDLIQIGNNEFQFDDPPVAAESEQMLSTLVMMSPPKVQPPETSSAAEPAFTIAADSAPEPPAQPKPDPAATTSELDKLDELVGSIRSHRRKELSAKEQKQAAYREEWAKLRQFGEQLKAKLEGDERVLYFAIARTAEEIMLRVRPSPNAAVTLLMLTLHHPDSDGQHDITGLWMRRSGNQDRAFQTADEIKAEVIRELAFLLA